MFDDTHLKVEPGEVFLADVLRTVVDNPNCTAEDVANLLGTNFESAYLGLRKLRENGRIDDHRGQYFTTDREMA